MAIRKENSVATRRSKPKSSAPIMVEPERETPGINAKHCAKPTLSASRTVISPSAPIRGARRALQPWRSTHRITMPPAISASATGAGANSAALIGLAKSKPSAAAGAHASAILGAQRPAQCGNRADLNHDIKGFGLLTGKIQRAAQNNQMPAAGYRDKFCKALGNAEQ